MGRTRGRVHVVRQGECIASIAMRYGHDDWRAVYDHPSNEALRQKRPSPHVLAPGDVVALPPTASDPLRVNAGGTNRFQGKRPRVPLRLTLRRADGEPLANARYELAVGAEVLEGTTTASGALEQIVEAQAESGTLRIFPDPQDPDLVRTVSLAIGHLDPIDTASGVRARLENLGYVGPEGLDPDRVAGEPHARSGEGEEAPAEGAMTRALRAFQAAKRLAETGELDDATREKLREEHRV
ncbi:peptidoglycan-binding domain-containing protein [Sorangium sp. So ce367]|uniref:peptidoglycan-binding domain-containing protein n=1 Tax=Sorangium sp. So ce367 TaxID=3133305 RepID=UPI003F5DB205